MGNIERIELGRQKQFTFDAKEPVPFLENDTLSVSILICPT